MAVVEVSLERKTQFSVTTTVEIPAGDESLTIKFPAAVPAGKKAVVKIKVFGELEDVT